MPKNKASAMQIQKKDPHRSFTMSVQGMAGLNTAISPRSIEDNEMQALWNYVPVGKNVVRTAQGAKQYATLPQNVSLFFNDVLGTSLVMFVILSDGSAGTVSPLGVYTQAVGAPPGTFNNTNQQIDICNWTNTYFLITDSVKGYFSFDGVNVLKISSSLNGNTLSVWQGRVLLAQGRTLNYSGALDYTFGVGNIVLWTASTAAPSYSFLQPNISNGFNFIVVGGAYPPLGPIQTGAIEPLWNTTKGGFTFDSNITPKGWQASYNYASATVPIIVNSNYFLPIITGMSGATIPTFNTTLGGHTTDNAVTWLTCSVPSIWKANNAYAVGSIITPSNNSYYVCTTAGVSGASQPVTWNTTPGGITIDGGVSWETLDVSSMLSFVQWEAVPATLQWQANAAYVKGDMVYPIGGNGYWYLCELAGTSGGAEPAFGTTVGNLTFDNGIEWLCVNIPVNSLAAGTFDITSTDLRQQIMKIIPYMDSIYIIGDHAIIALTGTTISNDPTNWYQMEVFNTLGTISTPTCVNFQNNIYLVNEYGMYRIASTQEVKIDVMLNGSLFSFVNSRGDVGQINNVNFYLIPAYGYSPVSNTNRYFIIAYCIELQKFSFLDFGFDVNGIFTTRSINDHSIYAWSGNKIYQLFQGTEPVTRLFQTKQYDMGADHVVKFIKYMVMEYSLYSGQVPVFQATAITQESE
jgi:hypothetical protein